MRVESLAIDPARVEESLLLVDAGAPGSPAPASGAVSAIPSIASRVRDALLAGRFEDVIGLWAEEWEARRSAVAGWPAPEAERIAGIVRAAGGAARVCGAGGAGSWRCGPLPARAGRAVGRPWWRRRRRPACGSSRRGWIFAGSTWSEAADGL